MQPIVTLLAHRPAVCTDRSTTLQLLVTVRAPMAASDKPPTLNLGLCIDRSGSMEGVAMQRALDAARHLVRQLQATDYINIVAFDSVVEVAASCRVVGKDTRPLEKRLGEITARGCTALHQGWLESACQTNSGAARGRLNRVLLLSDGQANEGLIDPFRIASQVADWHRRGVSTTTIGLGEGYNEDLLCKMARAGNGNFYHVRTPQEIVSTFSMELRGMFSTYGQAVSMKIAPKGGVELLRVVNPLEPEADGSLSLADLVYGAPIELVFEFLVPEVAAEQELCRFDLSWTNVHTGERFTTEHALTLPAVPHGQLSEFPLHPEVAHKRLLQQSARLLEKAVHQIAEHDIDGAGKTIRFGLEALEEAQGEGDRQLEDAAVQFRQLLASLARGASNDARKQATFYSSVVSSSSLILTGPMRDFLALPVEQRTEEKLRELIERAAGSQT